MLCDLCLFRCLENSSHTLGMTHCNLSEWDMSCLSLYPRVHQLKHLDLSGVTVFNLCHRLLGRVIERLTVTLEKLKLIDCMTMGFYSDVLLPALSQCSQIMRAIFWRTSCPWTVWRSCCSILPIQDCWPGKYTVPPMRSMMKSVMSSHTDLPNIVLSSWTHSRVKGNQKRSAFCVTIV